MAAPTRPDPSRTGAVWVTGTGAFLLLAAAAVFTAMRWQHIPDAVKLASLAAGTGACLLAGRSLKPSLPATAGALFHLGAFLVPVDVAAIGVRAGLEWPAMLLLQGAAATATFAWAAHTERSVVLRWAAALSAVALAGGIGATTVLPAPLVLAAFAAAALVARRGDLAVGWASVAGIAPLLTFLDRLATAGTGTFERLGLMGDQPRAAAVVTGGIAAAVLAVAGRRRDDAGLAILGALVAAVGVLASWTGLAPETSDSAIGSAVAFLVIELAAFATRDDRFWRIPTGVVARVAEIPARVATVAALGTVVLASFLDTSASAALAYAVLGLGWAARDARSDGRGTVSSTIGMAASTAAAVALATNSEIALSITLAGIAVVGLLLDRRAGYAVATVTAFLAPAVSAEASPATAVVVGVAGALLLAELAVRRSDATGADETTAVGAELSAWALAAVAMAPGAVATAALASATGNATAALVGAAVLATAIAAVADRGRTTSDLPLGTLARVQALSVLAWTTPLQPAEIGMVALSVAGLSALDAARTRRPEVALGASVALPIAVGTLCRAAGMSMPTCGVALTVCAAVVAGLGTQLGTRLLLPVVASIGFAIGTGLGLAAGDATALADAIIVTGGIGLAAAIGLVRLDGVFLAGAVVTLGTWLRLADGGVGASEPYLVPVCLLLLVAGVRARSIGTSSWVAYGPVVGLLGGSALLERISGGPGWHAVVAGTVGVLAVVAGGQRRLAAPLFLGTALVVALVGYETLAITAGLPTWTWLALGGSILLAAGVAMERHDVGPLETGRRMVDVVSDRFA